MMFTLRGSTSVRAHTLCAIYAACSSGFGRSEQRDRKTALREGASVFRPLGLPRSDEQRLYLGEVEEAHSETDCLLGFALRQDDEYSRTLVLGYENMAGIQIFDTIL